MSDYHFLNLDEWKKQVGWDELWAQAKAEVEGSMQRQGQHLEVFTKIALSGSK